MRTPPFGWPGRLFALAAIFVCVAASQASAVEPGEVLKDKALEARARHLSAELRCLVCQNQSIDDSNASLARDLRLLVRERLKKGDNDEQVLDYVVARYGEFVLLRPRFAWHTLLLWLAPALIFTLAALLIYRNWRRMRMADGTAAAPLSQAERERVEALLAKDDS